MFATRHRKALQGRDASQDRQRTVVDVAGQLGGDLQLALDRLPGRRAEVHASDFTTGLQVSGSEHDHFEDGVADDVDPHQEQATRDQLGANQFGQSQLSLGDLRGPGLATAPTSSSGSVRALSRRSGALSRAKNPSSLPAWMAEPRPGRRCTAMVHQDGAQRVVLVVIRFPGCANYSRASRFHGACSLHRVADSGQACRARNKSRHWNAGNLHARFDSTRSGQGQLASGLHHPTAVTLTSVADPSGFKERRLMSRKQQEALPDRNARSSLPRAEEAVASMDGGSLNRSGSHGTGASAAEEPGASSIATVEWWKVRLARQFGEGSLNVQVDEGSDVVLILGRLAADELAVLHDLIESSGQGDRVRALVRPV